MSFVPASSENESDSSVFSIRIQVAIWCNEAHRVGDVMMLRYPLECPHSPIKRPEIESAAEWGINHAKDTQLPLLGYHFSLLYVLLSHFISVNKFYISKVT